MSRDENSASEIPPELAAEIEELFAEMQSEGAKAAFEALLAASPEELGRAAVEAAPHPRESRFGKRR